jgi:predicted transcriptional regulator
MIATPVPVKRSTLTMVRKFRLDPALNARLDSVARANRVGVSTVIRTALMQLIAADFVSGPTEQRLQQGASRPEGF